MANTDLDHRFQYPLKLQVVLGHPNSCTWLPEITGLKSGIESYVNYHSLYRGFNFGFGSLFKFFNLSFLTNFILKYVIYRLLLKSSQLLDSRSLWSYSILLCRVDLPFGLEITFRLEPTIGLEPTFGLESVLRLNLLLYWIGVLGWGPLLDCKSLLHWSQLLD